jgi:hypothetical protein
MEFEDCSQKLQSAGHKTDHHGDRETVSDGPRAISEYFSKILNLRCLQSQILRCHRIIALMPSLRRTKQTQATNHKTGRRPSWAGPILMWTFKGTQRGTSHDRFRTT